MSFKKQSSFSKSSTRSKGSTHSISKESCNLIDTNGDKIISMCEEDLESCLPITVKQGYNLPKLQLYYPDYKWNHETLSPPTIKRIISVKSVKKEVTSKDIKNIIRKLKNAEIKRLGRKLARGKESQPYLLSGNKEELLKRIKDLEYTEEQVYEEAQEYKEETDPESQRKPIEYTAEYYHITPEEIDNLSKEGKIKKVISYHGAEHSASLFLQNYKDAQLGIYADVLLTMPHEKEYVRHLAEEFKHPLIIVTLNQTLQEVMEKSGIPKQNQQRWCTPTLKTTPIDLVLEDHGLQDAIVLMGIQSHQSSKRKKDHVKHGSNVYIDKRGGKKQLPIYEQSELENFKVMCKHGIPLNPNCMLTDRHGCLYCPYASADYYEYVKIHRPAQFKQIQDILRWGSKTRIEKYKWLKKHLPRLEKEVTAEDMDYFLDKFSNDRVWLGESEDQFEKRKNALRVILPKKNESKEDFEKRKEKKLETIDNMIRRVGVKEKLVNDLDLMDKFKNEAVYKTGDREGEFNPSIFNQLIKEEFKRFGQTEKGQKVFYNFLKDRFDSIDKYSKEGLYVRFPEKPELGI